MSTSEYKLVLGLEIHLHVKTQTKMFCGCSADIYGIEPNTNTCPSCLGLPGALPVPNIEAVTKTQLLGLALSCKLSNSSRFDRKHYFYPDLAKGYQISQYKQPLCEGGYMILDSGKKIEIERIHLEEDTAKSFHEGENTLIDFNMGGMPLIELVTKPVFTSAEEAGEFARKLRDLVRHLGISDADMEKGQLRIEPNISVRTAEMEEKDELPNYKVEVKNINSFRFMERAVNYEFERQSKVLEQGDTPAQENRGWDEAKNTTVGQRSKEEAHDYRYFPEPDIPPMHFDDAHFENLRQELPELPQHIRDRMVNDFKLSVQNAAQLTSGEGLEKITCFEQLVKEIDIEPNKIANLLLNKSDFMNISVADFKQKVAQMSEKIEDLEALELIVTEVLDENLNAVEDYKKGKQSAVQFLVGQVMRKTQGKASAGVVSELVEKRLKSN
jgi:aspartyl-tRNA(Asn)/glutamyl-tRNA(Gln) amidotransferase subunit B